MDDLNKPGVTIAYFVGAAEEGWVKQRFPLATLKGVTNSGATAPLEDIMAHRADAAPINRIPYVAMAAKVKGLAALPKENNCQNSTEKAQPVGLALDKGQPVFLDWLRAVEKAMHPKLEADEQRVAATLKKLDDLDFSPLLDSWRYLAAGLGVTLSLSALTIVSSLAFGAAVGFGRVYGPRWLSLALTFYIDSMRAIPVLVGRVWMYFAFPRRRPFPSALLGRRAALSLHIAAYVAEILRAGINSVRPGQIRAALALGFSGVQTVRQVVLPQAVIRMLPALGSIVSITIKDTAIAATIAVPEYMKQSETVAGQLPSDRGLHRRAAGLLPHSVSHDTPGRYAVSPRRASGPLMTFDWSVVWRFRDALAEGVAMTVLLAVCTMLIALPGGLLLALMWSSSVRPIAATAACFVEFFRNLPLILLIYWVYYVMPVAVGVEFSAFTTGLAALALNVSAYNAETFRAGIGSIRKGQTEAALALGMSRWQAMREIVLPQAVRRVLPVLASTWVSLFKDTSLVSVIGVSELGCYRCKSARRPIAFWKCSPPWPGFTGCSAIRRPSWSIGSIAVTECPNECRGGAGLS